MTKVLVTGGTGFIASHVIQQLLDQGHCVVTTVRSQEKADRVVSGYKHAAERLQVVIVPEIAHEQAFDEVVKLPGIEAVMHTASPCTLKFTDAKTELVDPALLGTTNVLRAVQRDAPQVRRIIITSSIAAILDVANPTATFSEESWNPCDMEALNQGPGRAYMLAKALAERAAWDYVADNKPNYDLVTVNPPVVFGPVLPHLLSVGSMNVSNQALSDLMSGKWKEQIPPAGPVNVCVDVRDVAAAHIRGMELSGAGGKRLFAVGQRFSNSRLAEIMRAGEYSFKDQLPAADVKGDAGAFGISYNNDETNALLGLSWTPLETTIGDFVKSVNGITL
ncbi:hypothetical protein FQN49_003402 [Arthroderma sp. PD_2]|nr:hypothetical protein FQN49_003402 [Arthroderma sp. PD_2]